MAGSDTDNVLIQPGVFARVVLGAVFTIMLGAGAWFAAENYLPADKVYSQSFEYTCNDENILIWQKRSFLELKFHQFKNIAHARYLGDIDLRLKSKYDIANNILTVYAVFPDDQSGSETEEIKESYFDKYASFIEFCKLSDVDPTGSLLDSGGIDYKINSWVKKNNETLKEMEHELRMLKVQYGDHEQKITEMMFAGAEVSGSSQVENEEIKLLSDKVEGLHKKLAAFDLEQKDLDLMAAKCTDASELKKIDADKNKIFSDRQKLISEIRNIEKQLEETKVNIEPVSIQPVKSSQELTNEKEKLASVRYKMQLIQNNISQLKGDIDFVKGLTGVTGVNSVQSMVDAAANDSLVFYGKFVPKKPYSELEVKETYSFVQILVMAVAVIAGWLMGMAVYSKIVSIAQAGMPAELKDPEKFRGSFEQAEKAVNRAEKGKDTARGASDNVQPANIKEVVPARAVEPAPKPVPAAAKRKFDDFESWWVESYDRISFQLMRHSCSKEAGVILSSLDKSKASPRFAVNLAISLALKNQKVLLASASDDGMLEKIFKDFHDEYPAENTAGVDILDDNLDKNFEGLGFWNCLENNKDFYLYSTSTTLENLRFISAGTKNSKSNPDNEINNNSINAEKVSVSYFDWILVYMPELLSGGVKGFEAKSAEGPITLLLSKFKDIAVIDFMNGSAKRKGAALKKVITSLDCRLVEFE